MAIAHVGTELYAFLGATGGTTSNLDTTTCNLIVAIVQYFSGAGGRTNFADSEANSWEEEPEQENAVGTQIYWCLNPTTDASHNFTVSKENAADIFANIYVYRFSGVVEFQESKGSTRGGIPGTSLQPGAILPLNNGALIITGGIFSSASALDVDSGLTKNIQDGNKAAAFKIQGTAASINPTYSWTTNSEGSCSMAVFLETASAGDQAVTGGTIASTLSLFAPTVGSTVANGTIASTLALFAPTVANRANFNALSIWP